MSTPYFAMIAAFFVGLSHSLHAASSGGFIYSHSTESASSANQKLAIAYLMEKLCDDALEKPPTFYHILKSADPSSGWLQLEDGSEWQIGSWHRQALKFWRRGDRLALYYSKNCVYPIRLENLEVPRNASGDSSEKSASETSDHRHVWGVIALKGGSEVAIAKITSEEGSLSVELKNGWVWTQQSSDCRDSIQSLGWKVSDPICLLHQEGSDEWGLWNFHKKQIIYNWLPRIDSAGARGKKPPSSFHGIDREVALRLEEQLNRRVISQPEATKALAHSILNYCAGLKDEKAPVGVFLFLGPSGVGKTELAKALATELYHSPQALIRFDMSHFSEPHTLARLIGSPPGYANYEEGGQLTEALKSRPRSIVLLDEIEKAHPAVHKLFLPVFDEGYLTDSKDETVLCDETIFIMTSNLCSGRIQELYKRGCSPQEILSAIEPLIIEKLSPEVYNRVEPVIFQPLSLEAMALLVDIVMGDLVSKLKSSRNIDFFFDEGVKTYLISYGYHPLLGARPLKKLIQKTVVATLSEAIISENIPHGSRIDLSYEEADDSWHLVWSKNQLELGS